MERCATAQPHEATRTSLTVIGGPRHFDVPRTDHLDAVLVLCKTPFQLFDSRLQFSDFFVFLFALRPPPVTYTPLEGYGAF